MATWLNTLFGPGGPRAGPGTNPNVVKALCGDKPEDKSLLTVFGLRPDGRARFEVPLNLKWLLNFVIMMIND